MYFVNTVLRCYNCIKMYFRKFLVPLVNASNSQIAYIIFNKFPVKRNLTIIPVKKNLTIINLK